MRNRRENSTPTALLLLLALLVQDPPPASASEAERVVTSPNWAERPSGAEVARLFPHRALQHRVSGQTVIGCRVTGEGRLRYCRIEAEEPEGYGFDESALAMADRFSMTAGHGGGASAA